MKNLRRAKCEREFPLNSMRRAIQWFEYNGRFGVQATWTALTRKLPKFFCLLLLEIFCKEYKLDHSNRESLFTQGVQIPEDLEC